VWCGEAVHTNLLCSLDLLLKTLLREGEVFKNAMVRELRYCVVPVRKICSECEAMTR